MTSFSGPSGRSAWADIAKGACIVLVVLWHVVAKHYLRVDWHPHTAVPALWGGFGETLLPLRMPVFFTVSGVFATSAVAASWPVLLRGRVARFGYLYAVWVLVDTVLLRLTPLFPTERADSPHELLAALSITPTNLWYLLALAWYFLLARAARSLRIPVPWLLAAALLLSVLASAGLLPHASALLAGNRIDVLQNLVFFLGGLHLRPYVERAAAQADRTRLLIGAVVFGGAVLVVTATGTLGAPLVWPGCAALATGFSVTAASLLARRRRVGPALGALGRRTLPVYVIHLPVLAGLDRVLAGPLGRTTGSLSVVLQIAEPAAATVVVVATSLLVHRALVRGGAIWLFALPGRSGRPAGQPVGT